MRKIPLVSVITVNYNGKHLLRDCFESLQNLNYPKTKIEIFMVDNGSVDGSIDYVRNNFPKVKIITNNENNYARANNLGIKAAKGEFIALINNDVKVDKNWLLTLVETAQKDNSIGAVGSKILFMDGTIQSIGHQENPDFYWCDIAFGEEDTGKYCAIREVEGICGCSVLYRKECLKDVGFLDEDFNMFVEDVDLCIRCRKKGWKLVTCPGSILHHKYHGTIKSEEDAWLWIETNRLVLIAKHWPDKLADTLLGRCYFTVRNEHAYDNVRDISFVLGKVFAKLIKEHGAEFADKLSGDLFNAVRKIYNFEKDILIQEIRDRNKRICLKDQELSQKDEQIESLRQQKEKEIASMVEKTEHLQTDLSHKEKELQDICSSTGYKYLLKPVWDFLWPIKGILRKGNIISKMLSKSKETFINIKLNKAYFSHINNNTFPPPPQRLVLMITKHCNLNCVFCHVSKRECSKEFLSKEEVFKIIDQSVNLGVKDLYITGGEPFLHPQLFDILDYTKTKSLRVDIATNGTLIKDALEKIKGSQLYSLSISIDGRLQTHDELRGGNSFERVMEGIDAVIESAIPIRLKVNFVVTNKNVFELEGVYDYFSRKNILVNFWPVNNHPDLYFKNDSEKKAFLNFVRKLKTRGDISSSLYGYYLKALRYFEDNNLRVRCLGLVDSFAVDTEGNILPCCVWNSKGNFILGNALEDDLELLWHSQEFLEARRRIYKEGCGNCYNIYLNEFPAKTGMSFCCSNAE
jgi:radical SAM protein with 4Fe4S-binding SPASM domain